MGTSGVTVSYKSIVTPEGKKIIYQWLIVNSRAYKKQTAENTANNMHAWTNKMYDDDILDNRDDFSIYNHELQFFSKDLTGKILSPS